MNKIPLVVGLVIMAVVAIVAIFAPKTAPSVALPTAVSQPTQADVDKAAHELADMSVLIYQHNGSWRSPKVNTNTKLAYVFRTREECEKDEGEVRAGWNADGRAYWHSRMGYEHEQELAEALAEADAKTMLHCVSVFEWESMLRRGLAKN